LPEVPAYDYRCPECESVGEVFHGMNESPTYLCPQCGVPMRRVFNTFNLGHGKRRVQRRIEDKLKAESDMKQEMREDYGVEGFQPIAAQSVAEVYNDVKGSGSFVRDRMQAEAERAQAKRKKKSREWMSKAMRRAPERSREQVERKKAQEAKGRAISI
jgi:putative FmdB family regulatory protein